MRLPFHTLDVFTDKRFSGNPLAVVHDADALSPVQMQTIAREFNLSETVFVLSTAKPAHTARLRIFTPASELPFAGHPTVGAAALLAELRAPETNGERDALIILDLTIGTVRVGVRQRPGQAAFAEFDLPKMPERGAAPPTTDLLAPALGLIPSEIGFENHRASLWSAGVPYVLVPVASREVIARAGVRQPHFGKVFSGAVPGGCFLYCRDCVHVASAFHARMFWPTAGMVEDPATGSAVAAFAGAIHEFDAPTDGIHRKIIEQGFEMGRPSLVSLTIEVEAGRLAGARIGGHAVRIAEGTIEL
jgi:trans-2,3-dihydro-3-hydroxyanthranilate isomerase